MCHDQRSHAWEGSSDPRKPPLKSSTEPGWPIHLWVFEANAGARGFYDALGGEVVERRQKEILEGIEIPSLLYVWHDLIKLLNNLTRGSTRTGKKPAG